MRINKVREEGLEKGVEQGIEIGIVIDYAT